MVISNSFYFHNVHWTFLKVSEQEAGDEDEVRRPVSARARSRREESVELEALGHEDALDVMSFSCHSVKSDGTGQNLNH